MNRPTGGSSTGLTTVHTHADHPGAPTLLFIHGFLDDAEVWGGVIDALAGHVNTMRYDLPGFGARAHDGSEGRSPLSLDSLAAEAGAIVDTIGTPVVIVGQSLGAQVAELVAAEHRQQVDGLVLLTPVPLAGTRLPEETIAPFRTLGDNPQAQRGVRSRISPKLDELQLDELVRRGASVRPDIVARYADLWNDGTANAPGISEYTGPALVIRGGADTFVTGELIETVVPRFPHARVETVDGGGHWLHVEFPEQVAAMLLTFTAALTRGRTAMAWRQAFSEQSRARFTDWFADGIVLEASILAEPVRGREAVAATMTAASAIYESLEFTAESHDATTSYLQWRATAFGGSDIRGVTVLTRDACGRIVAAAIHHRLLGAVLRFSAELRGRLAGVIADEHFVGFHTTRPT